MVDLLNVLLFGLLAAVIAYLLGSVSFSIIFTKIDKISKGRLKENLKVYTDKLLETWEELPPIFLSSSEKKEGRDEILDYIESINNSLNN